MMFKKELRRPIPALAEGNGRKSQKYTPPANLPLAFLLLLLLSPTPNAASGGFRLCGLKLTMTLNAICKNQLCGGYIMGLAKRKSPDLDSSPSMMMLQGRSTDLTASNENSEADDETKGANDDDFGANAPDLDEIVRQISDAKMQQRNGGGGRHKRAYYPYGAFAPVKKSGGIATQCCEKRCTLAYLKTYCCAVPAAFQEEAKNEEEGRQQEER